MIKNIIIIVLAFLLSVVAIDDDHQRALVNELNTYIVQIGE